MSDSTMTSVQREYTDDDDSDLTTLLNTAFKDHASQKYRIELILYSLQQTFHQYRLAVSEQYRENEKVVNDLNELQQPADGTMVIQSPKGASLLEARVSSEGKEASILLLLLQGGLELVRRPNTFVSGLVAFECARMHVLLLHMVPVAQLRDSTRTELHSRLSEIRQTLSKVKKMLLGEKQPVGNLQLVLSSLELGITSLPLYNETTEAMKVGFQLAMGIGKSIATMRVDPSVFKAVGKAAGMTSDHMRKKNADKVYNKICRLSSIAIAATVAQGGKEAVTEDLVDKLKHQIISLQQEMLDGEPRWEVVAEFVGFVGDLLIQECASETSGAQGQLCQWVRQTISKYDEWLSTNTGGYAVEERVEIF
jgi:hypothetical protein